MELINNTTKTLKDDLSVEIKKGSKLSIAAACFSIYAFQELKKQLTSIELPQVVQTVQKQTSNGRKLKFKQQTDFVFQAESVLFLFEYDICCKS